MAADNASSSVPYPPIASDICSASDPEKCFDSKTSASSIRSRRVLLWSGVAVVVAAIIALALGLGLHFGLQKSAYSKTNSPTKYHMPSGVTSISTSPVIDSNFPDPAYIKVGGTYWAFATNKHADPHSGQINVQVARSNDFQDWDLLGDVDALPTVGAWSIGSHVWAPDVVQLDDGSFLLYYSAPPRTEPSKHCVGTATSKNVTGPYTPAAQPLICPLDQGGAIDPEGYKDADGTRYVIYKVDGNSMNRPGESFRSTPIMLQQVQADGVTRVYDPIQLLDRSERDGTLIEAPAMARYQPKDHSKPPVYVLFYSSDDFTTPNYDVSYATSSSVKGPFARSNAALLKTGDAGNKLVGPGGLDCGVDSTQVVFHSIRTSSDDGSVQELIRTMWTANLTVTDDGDLKIT